MDVEPWIQIFHDISIITAAVAAAIAAGSSLRNGRTLKKADEKLEAVQKANGNRKRKKTSNAESNGNKKNDWYEPPDLS